MSKKRLLLPAFLVSCLLLAGCFAMDDLELEALLTDTEDLAVDLSADPDPEVQAAAAASQEIQKDEEAQRSMQRALDNNQLDAALEAVELRPLDPYHRLKFGALLLANDDRANAKGEFEFAGAIMHHERYSRAERLELALTATLEVRETFAPESEPWNRLNGEYCLGLSRYRELAPEETTNVFGNIFGAVTLPDDTCE